MNKLIKLYSVRTQTQEKGRVAESRKETTATGKQKKRIKKAQIFHHITELVNGLAGDGQMKKNTPKCSCLHFTNINLDL